MLDKLRVFLARHVFTLVQGAAFGDWWRLLRQNRFAVDVPYWPRALHVTASTLANSMWARLEESKYGRQIDAVQVRPPVFVLGHYRSGTTHLHNLLSLDPQFAFPTLLQTLYPHTFLTSGAMIAPAMKSLMLPNRPQDNMTQGVDSPAEDEFALCVATSLSPYMRWAFPRSTVDYESYLTFRSVPNEELHRWKAAFVRFLKKLTLVSDRPLLLKSPPHTARIRLLLELFPDARFVHIHRHPYTVFQSQRHLWKTGPPYWQLERPAARQPIDDRIIDTYSAMYGAFFEERDMIPAGRLCEVAFEAVERDPVREIEKIYQALGLSGFPSVLTSLEAYVGSISGYQKNKLPDLPPPLRQRIRHQWRRSFEEWQYDA